ncbi:MAG: tetratricopeptide repeat protein, partial [bacterium]
MDNINLEEFLKIAEKYIPKESRKEFTLELYRKTAENDGQTDLGNCYKNGEEVEKDLDKAFELYTKSAEQGNANAQFNLGVCYKYGIGTKQDYNKAFEWFTKSAEQGNSDGQNNLGVCYVNGIGTKQDYNKAFKL